MTDGLASAGPFGFDDGDGEGGCGGKMAAWFLGLEPQGLVRRLKCKETLIYRYTINECALDIIMGNSL